MKQFLLTFLAVVAAFVAVYILGFVCIVGLLAMLGSGSESPKVKPNTVLFFDISKNVVERSDSDPMSSMMRKFNGDEESIGLDEIVDKIASAADDDNIVGIALEGGDIGASPAALEQIRTSLLDFKESGKFIYSYANDYSQRGYYLATVADKIMLTPEGMAEISGVTFQTMFYAELLKKLGIEAQVIRHGKFKSAVEPAILNEMSEASRLQMQTLANTIWGRMTADIAEARGIGTDQINLTADSLFSVDSRRMVAEGYIDSLIYRDQYLSFIKQTVGIDEADDIESVSLALYTCPGSDDDIAYSDNSIALIYADGQIYDGHSDDTDDIYGDDLARTIREARRDTTVKAIVLRVNSPGGSALASDVIWREVKLAREAKPVVVSMGTYAASGGYYISCAADTIVAEATTLTGSIGVFGLFYTAKGLTEKIGINIDGVKTNACADFGRINRPLTAYERALLQKHVESTYATFISRCAEGRKMTTAQIDSIGQGRVWAGADALRLGLVDRIGHLDDAIDIAARMADLGDDYDIEILPEAEDSFSKLMRQLGGNARLSIARHLLGADYDLVGKANAARKLGNGVQARMEYDIVMQ